MPEDGYKPWKTCASLKEAKEERRKLAFRFLSREVVIRDEDYQIVR